MQAWIATILAVHLVAGTARADDTEAAAQVHLDRGVAAFGAGDFTLALHELQIVVELVPHKPNPYRWLALTEIQQGDCAHDRLDVESFLARVAADDPRIPELIRSRDACKQRGVPQITVAPPSAQQPVAPPPASRPLVTRWWFWTALGVAAAATTGILIYVSRDDDPNRLPPIVCDSTDCRMGAL
jgi:hypothetical protein